MDISLYLVTGPLRFRDHAPGSVFETTLTPEAEARAIERGNIRLLERSTPAIRPGTYRLPDGWAAR